MKIYLIRHGETDWNVQRRYQGRENIPLNENGILQAEQCGMVLQGECFAAVISSPLIRARRTAEIIALYVGIQRVVLEQALTERDFGQISGMTIQEREDFFASGQETAKEPWEAVIQRMIACLYKYAQKYQENDKIIMVSHGAAIRAALDEFTGGEIGNKGIILKNTCISILNYGKGVLTLEAYNLSPNQYSNQYKKKEEPEGILGMKSETFHHFDS
jgi:uncharacterized phosphatase